MMSSNLPPLQFVRDVRLISPTFSPFVTPPTSPPFSPYVMHRSREYWHDADHFQPERWLPLQHRPGYAGFMSLMSNVGEAVNGAYVPFGAGPRNCIGTGVKSVVGSVRGRVLEGGT